ncbi:Lipid droplet-associated triacylglycerol lipase [Pseudozyma hubeiensis]|nr:Lipid droplet-associated triacylglycerol lipase [Pseudozyma hubeiensis]
MRPTPSIASSLSLPITTSFAGAQALWWPSPTATPPRVVLLFIPGNPGLSSYYIDFLHSIYTSSSLKASSVEILSVSHRGHAPLPKIGSNPVWGDNRLNQTQASKGYGCTLGDQVRHKIAVVDAVNKMYNAEKRETKVVLVGHSIGAWIATEVLKARPDGVDGLHMLFPTLAWIGRTPNARRIKLALLNPVSMALLSIPLLVFTLLPLWVMVWLVRLITGQREAAALATAELLTTRGAVFNALRMAKEEFSTVQQLEASTVDSISKFTSESAGGRVRSYWASEDSDSWAPSWIRTQVESSLGLHRVHLPPGLGLDATRPRLGSVGTKSHVRTRSFSVSEYRSSPGSIPDLRNAKAIRKPNGEIVIEAQVNESSSDSEDDFASSTANGKADTGASARGMQYHYGRSRATSTHCRIGMPHAFCLKHSDDMAKVVGHWIAYDHLSREGQ